MLADYLRAEISNPRLPLFHLSDRLTIARLLDDSQKMVVSHEVFDAACQVSLSRPTSILSAMPLVRLPYKQFWLEWNEPEFDLSWGAIFDCHDSYGSGTFRVFYRNVNGLFPTGVAVWFDFERDVNLVRWSFLSCLRDYFYSLDLDLDGWENAFGPYRLDAETDEMRVKAAQEAWKQRELFPEWLKDKREVDAFWEIQKRFFVVYDTAFVKWIQTAVGDTEEQFVDYMFEFISPVLAPQLVLVRAVLALLNSRNCTALQSIDAQPVPKSLRKRLSSQKELYSHRILKLDLNKAQLSRAKANGLSSDEARAHLVRGHFKVRKTGIFWWSPFVRGNSRKGIVTKDYLFEKPPPGC